MGMLLGRLGRAHVAMIYKVSEPVMELPSDIQGYIYIPYEKSVEEAAHQLAKEMAAADFFAVPVQKI
jgi:predicted nucleotide-binding protein